MEESDDGVTRGTRALRCTTRVVHWLNGDCEVEVEQTHGM